MWVAGSVSSVTVTSFSDPGANNVANIVEQFRLDPR
jgi:hypothetical protein